MKQFVHFLLKLREKDIINHRIQMTCYRTLCCTYLEMLLSTISQMVSN